MRCIPTPLRSTSSTARKIGLRNSSGSPSDERIEERDSGGRAARSTNMRDAAYDLGSFAPTDSQPAGKAAARGVSKSLPSSPPRRLFWWDEIPTVLQFNRFIRSGYRAGATPAESFDKACQKQRGALPHYCRVSAGLSRRECLCSIFKLHNETGMQLHRITRVLHTLRGALSARLHN